MKQKYIGLAMGVLVSLAAVLSLPSCGHDQKLVSLAVTPASPGFTFPVPNAGATGQYTATATYIHPPATKDVTNQATWAVDDGVVSIKAGLVTTNGSCGSADVSATMPEGTGGSSNIVIGYSFVTVEDTSNPHCPGGSATNGELVVATSGNGTVTSQPAGIQLPRDLWCLVSDDGLAGHVDRNSRRVLELRVLGRMHGWFGAKSMSSDNRWWKHRERDSQFHLAIARRSRFRAATPRPATSPASACASPPSPSWPQPTETVSASRHARAPFPAPSSQPRMSSFCVS